MVQHVEAPGDEAQGSPRATPHARWFAPVAWVLTLAGLGISAYLTVSHYDEGALICSTTGAVDCHAVTTSEFSTLLGIPLPLLGLAFFVGFAVLVTPPALRSPSPLLRWGRLASVCAGVLFVVYLVTAEFLLGKICLWCTGVHAITILLFVLVLSDEFRRIGQLD
ncbi:vitamin K epoxide reductase family protein [Actinomadura flavalba]|uniref:vitamin K epoxide reductase family protein n=1 Tax=Actinomadura flavalba TaxID=1120938 RepID=UPI0012DD1565|nr:vitamin K epoxide reductase family protein [Actinomadura flavalba]